MNADELRTHEIHDQLQNVAGLCANALTSETSPQVRDNLRRLEEAQKYISTSVSQARAVLVPRTSLNDITEHVRQCRNALEAYMADRNPTYVATANDSIDLALAGLGALPRLPFKAQSSAIKSAADDYFQRLTDNESALMAELARVSSEIDVGIQQFGTSLAESLEKLQMFNSDADMRLNTFQTSAADAMTQAQDETQKQLTALSTEISNQRSTLQATISDFQKQFSTAQEKRLEDANELLKKLELDFHTKADDDLDRSEGLQKAWANQAESFMKDIESKANTAAHRLGIIAAADVAYAYTTEAKEQRDQADLWRRIAMFLFVALAVGAAATSIVRPPDPDFTTSDYVGYFATHLALVVALAPGVPYAIKQSSEHRRRERLARRKAQELTAFRPFLAELSEDEQKDLIKTTAPKYFGGDSFDAEIFAEELGVDVHGLGKIFRKTNNGTTSRT
jgi:hypothetical protein